MICQYLTDQPQQIIDLRDTEKSQYFDQRHPMELSIMGGSTCHINRWYPEVLNKI